MIEAGNSEADSDFFEYQNLDDSPTTSSCLSFSNLSNFSNSVYPVTDFSGADSNCSLQSSGSFISGFPSSPDNLLYSTSPPPIPNSQHSNDKHHIENLHYIPTTAETVDWNSIQTNAQIHSLPNNQTIYIDPSNQINLGNQFSTTYENNYQPTISNLQLLPNTPSIQQNDSVVLIYNSLLNVMIPQINNSFLPVVLPNILPSSTSDMEGVVIDNINLTTKTLESQQPNSNIMSNRIYTEKHSAALKNIESITLPNNKAKPTTSTKFNEENEKNICLICGDLATSHHYGVKSCEGCKGFFKRTIQKNAAHTYVCNQNESCIIDKQNRNRCQFCRFQKCMQTGMVKEIVRKECLKGRRGRLSLKVRMKNQDNKSLYTVVNLLSTVKNARDRTEPVIWEELIPEDVGKIIENQNLMDDKEINSYILRQLQSSLVNVKEFAEYLVGFKNLTKRDQNLLILLNGFEFLTLQTALRLNNKKSKMLFNKMGSFVILENGSILSERLIERSIFYNWLIKLRELHELLLQAHQGDENVTNGLLAVSLLKTDTTSNVRKLLENSSLVYSLCHRYIEVLKTQCNTKLIEEHDTIKMPSTAIQKNTDSKFLYLLLQCHQNAQLSVYNWLILPMLKYYFNAESLDQCEAIFEKLKSGQEIESSCPKWLFKIIAFKTVPQYCSLIN